jgi:hypothetical protein
MFVGRVDSQVKRRGHRIELSEIEHALRDVVGIVDAVVVLQLPEQYLVAYVITKSGESYDAASIKRQLSHRMPNYMLPDAVVCMDAYPLNSNGKIDKLQLPKWVAASSHTTASQAISENHDLVLLIQRIWEDVLGSQPVNQENNFFEMGGNSLKLILVLDRLQEHFKDNDRVLQKLGIDCLFQYPTIRDLAAHLATNQETSVAPVQHTTRVNVRDKRKNARLATDSVEME